MIRAIFRSPLLSVSHFAFHVSLFSRGARVSRAPFSFTVLEWRFLENDRGLRVVPDPAAAPPRSLPHLPTMAAPNTLEFLTSVNAHRLSSVSIPDEAEQERS